MILHLYIIYVGEHSLLVLWWHVYGGERTTRSSLLLPCGSLTLNSGWRLGSNIFPAELFQQLGLCISENSLRNHECNLAVGILRAAKKVISSEQLWEKRPNYYPHLPRETRESRWLRTELFLELKSAFVEAYALNAHTPVPPQTSFFYAFHLDLLSHGFLRINLCILWR